MEQVIQQTARTVEQVAQFFDLLADPSRLKILLLLDQEGEKNSTELQHTLGTSQPVASYHLALLRRGLLVEPRRAGRCVHYRLASPAARNLLWLACRLVEGSEKDRPTSAAKRLP